MSVVAAPFHTFVRVIQPSLMSFLVTTIIGLLTVVVLLAPSLYKGSDFEQYFEAINIQETPAYSRYEAVSNTVNNSDLAANVSVFVVWMIIGFLAYAVVGSLWKLVVNFTRFVQDVEYFKQSRESIALEAFVHLVVRLLAALTIYGLFQVFMKFGLVYLFIFAHNALSGGWLQGVWYGLLMFLIVVVYLHIFVVLLRLAVLRIRVFYERYFVAEQV